MFELDEISHLLKVDTDLTVREIESRLNPMGFTLGYFFPPDNEIILEEALSHHLPNAYSLLYGSVQDLCVALQWETNRQEAMSTKVAPRKATGPCWKNMVLGTRRKLGLIYQAVLKIFPHPLSVSFSLISLSALEDSFPLERELKRKELMPRAFGRFARSEGGRVLPAVEEFFLLLEWAAFPEILKTLNQEAEGLFRKMKFDAHTLAKKSEQHFASKLLKKRLPEIPWGGKGAAKQNPPAKELAREILEALR
jgi:hypothetical protein